MGLFDGILAAPAAPLGRDLARLYGLPVRWCSTYRVVSTTVAAVAKGFATYDRMYAWPVSCQPAGQ